MAVAGGSLSAFQIWLGFDVCIDVDVVTVGQVCGADVFNHIPELEGDLPFIVFNETMNISGVCSSGSGSGSGSAQSWALNHDVHEAATFNAAAIHAEVALKKGSVVTHTRQYLASKPAKLNKLMTMSLSVDKHDKQASDAGHSEKPSVP